MSFITNASVVSMTVTRVKASDYETKTVIMRENGMLLYGPDVYDIVLPLPLSESKNGAIRICRLKTENIANMFFNSYSDKIPILWRLMRKDIKELQEICDMIRSMNQLSSIAHLVVLLNKPSLLKDPSIVKKLNDERCGYTPIMLAIKKNNLEMVRALISLKCSLSILDSEHKNVLHYAAVLSETKILELLLENKSLHYDIEKYDANGKTPLSYAIESGNLKASELLIQMGGNLSSCSVNGASTLLHDCKDPKILNMFLAEKTININLRNSKGLTPLHLFVKTNNYDCAIAVLSHGADPCLCDEDGNSPLHSAVDSSVLEIVLALIVFGADVDHLNYNNRSVRHIIDLNKNDSKEILAALHSVSARRCPPDVTGCTDACISNGTYNGPVTFIDLTPQTNILHQLLSIAAMEKTADRKQKITGGRVLCLDGGGVRGLVLIQMLKMLEALAQKPIIECFDWVSGTSAGGIISLALASGKSLTECQSLYFKLKDDVLNESALNSGKILENLLQKQFGNDISITNIKHPKLLVTSVLFEKNPLRLHMFRNYPSPQDMLKYKDNQNPLPIVEVPIWKVARATSAAPMYFTPFEDYVDGGLIANNPTLDTLTEILEYKLAKRFRDGEEVPFATVVVSCGTGLVPTKGTLRSFLRRVGHFSSIGIIEIAKNFFHLIKDISDIIVDLISGADGRHVDRARAWCCTAGVPYFRLNPPMSADISLNETSNKLIVHMMWETMVYMHNNKALVREIVDTLSQD